MMSMEISYEINGRKINSDKFCESIVDQTKLIALEATAEHIKKYLNSVICPEHEERPILTMKFENSDLSLTFPCCCDLLKNQVSEILQKEMLI